jgi:predicted nucleic acid-binding protein
LPSGGYLTLVTHNTQDFKKIPGLRLDDWLLD